MYRIHTTLEEDGQTLQKISLVSETLIVSESDCVFSFLFFSFHSDSIPQFIKKPGIPFAGFSTSRRSLTLDEMVVFLDCPFSIKYRRNPNFSEYE